ncbi:hypothetical protein EMPS_10635 [Entomortierella parvispora]|uniref:Uncharacterized protein n=1 Tax=Entomortierella parvispora TaxID=205924 RepID=A0A9P3HKH9_9FUNG|nr:hypothetical protein EMPS_10635 [Entomortierella parvispora]
MSLREPVYYENHKDQFDDLSLDEDEEYREDMFLSQHYGRPPPNSLLVHDDEDTEDEEDHYNYIHNHQGRHDFHEDGEDDEVDEDEYDEVDMDQHNIQLLSGSLSVRSPFLDAIREEEDEEPVFTKPSSYPSLGSGRYLNRRSGEGFGAWSARNSPLGATSEEQKTSDDQLQASLSNTLQSESGKPRGPRPPLQLGRPRSGTTSSSPLTKVTSGFDIPHSSSPSHENQASESSIQDLEVKRVLESAAAMASGQSSSVAMTDSGKDEGGLETKSTDSTPLPSVINLNAASLSSSGNGVAGNTSSSDPAVSFGQDTQKSIDDFFGMVKSDLDKRIQEAIQEVEQKFLQRVQRLEEHTAVLAGTPEDLAVVAGSASGSGSARPGSLMESLTRSLPANQNPGGSLALRKEILSHVTEKVGDLDLRVNQMEVLVSYKLVDIESKVQDLHGAHNSMAQKVHQVAQSHKSNMQGVRAGDGVGQDTITAEEQRVSNAMQPYREMDAEGRPGEYLEALGNEGTISLKKSATISDQTSAIVELRNELHSLGMQYQELNDGLLTDLMGQMRDAKLILFQTVDEVDGRISKRVDRIEAEMHSKLLSEIEGRVAERVRAMEQTSSRLERCFDKMEGRLGALETVLASKRPRPESMYQLLQQQLQQQQQEEEDGVSAGLNSTSEPVPVPYIRPRRRTLAENGYDPSDYSSSPRQDPSDDKPMTLEAASMPSTITQSHTPGSRSQLFDPATLPMVASPLEGFVSPAQGQPIWSPTTGITPLSKPASKSGGVIAPVVASPLERSTIIGSRMGTIHPEYQPRTSYVPLSSLSSQMSSKDKPQSGSVDSGLGANASQSSSIGSNHGSRVRRVSLPNFDANSLSALKPIKASTATASESSSSTSIVTTTTTTTTLTTQVNSLPPLHADSDNVSVKSISSILTAKLSTAPPSAGTSGAASGGIQGESQGSDSGNGQISMTMRRAMTFDTLHTQASTSSTITKTVKTPVQGPSSYREILHFWKAGGSGSSKADNPALSSQ